MNLNDLLAVGFLAECAKYRADGFTDIALASDQGESTLRGDRGSTTIPSPSLTALHYLLVVMLGEDRAGRVVQGGSESFSWQGMRVSARRVHEHAPIHVVVRLNP